MNSKKKILTKQEKKDRNTKIAEIIWLSIGFFFLVIGIGCLVVGMIINNLGTDKTSLYSSPLYGLIEAQDSFKTWWNGWCFWKFSSFNSTGTYMTLITCVYMLIVFAYYASKEDAKNKRLRAKQLRERNAKKILEENSTTSNETL